MVDFGRGLKAGVVAGIIYGVIWGAILFAIPSIIFASLWNLPGFQAAWAVVGILVISITIIAGIIGGLIWGLIFALLYDYLPTQSSYPKAYIVSIIFWLVFDVLLNLGYIGDPIYLGISFVFGVIVFGSLMAFLWDSFAPPTTA